MISTQFWNITFTVSNYNYQIMSCTCSTHTTSQDTKSSFSIQRLSLLHLYLNGFSPNNFKKLLIVLYMALCSQESLSSNGRIQSKAKAVEEMLLSRSFYSTFSETFLTFGFRTSCCLCKKWYIFSNHLEFNAISTFHVHDCQTRPPSNPSYEHSAYNGEWRLPTMNCTLWNRT